MIQYNDNRGAWSDLDKCFRHKTCRRHNSFAICQVKSKVLCLRMSILFFIHLQHIVDNYHCPRIWFSTCSKKVVHLVVYVCATFNRVIKLKYLIGENLIGENFRRGKIFVTWRILRHFSPTKIFPSNIRE